jgi:hypothetical protein
MPSLIPPFLLLRIIDRRARHDPRSRTSLISHASIIGLMKTQNEEDDLGL